MNRHVLLKRTATVCIVLVTVLISAAFLRGWLESTRSARSLCKAISISGLDSESKTILTRLAWTRPAWDSGLIDKLRGPVALKKIVWKGTTKRTQGRERAIYIFDAFARPVADFPIPPVCVVFDTERDLVAWTEVAPYSEGFLSASLDENDVLTVVTVANWFYGKGIYRYTILGTAIKSLGDGKFVKFDDNESVDALPKLIPFKPI
jgi:hypothetical protein